MYERFKLLLKFSREKYDETAKGRRNVDDAVLGNMGEGPDCHRLEVQHCP